MTSPIVLDQHSPSWTLDDLLTVLSKLPSQDLTRFLKSTYPNEALEEWDHADLLDLSLSLMQTWERDSTSLSTFLIQSTASICRASFEAFVRLFWYDVPTAQLLKWNWHMTFLCGEAQCIAERIIRGEPKEYDEVINISPSSSKSSIISILYPMWLWARMPSARIISASGTDKLATDLSVKSRTAMKSRNYSLVFPEIQFSEDQDAKGHFRNTMGGERLVSTVGGVSPIGFHAHCILVDDPSDPERVRSEAHREAVRRFFTEVIRFRKIDISVTPLFLVMQRLEWDDATHVVLKEAEKEGAFPIKHVCLPAELTDDVSPPELRRFYIEYNEDAKCLPDGMMDPIRLNKRVLGEARTNRWVYISQYLQRPVPPGGDMFKLSYFQTRSSAPLACRRVRVWDRASTPDGGCYTAGVLMAVDSDRTIYVEGCVHGQWGPVDRNNVMLTTAIKDRNRYGRYEPVIWVEREPGSSGRDAFLGIVRHLAGFTVREIDVSRMGSKDTRAEPWAAQLAGMNVWLIDNGERDGIGRAEWDIAGFIEEHNRFRPDPTTKKRTGGYCDRVDASAEAYSILFKYTRVNDPLRTYQLIRKRNQGRWLVACSVDELSLLDIDENQRVLIILFSDPQQEADKPIIVETPRQEGEGFCTSQSSSVGMQVVMREGNLDPPPPSFPSNLGSLEICCADIDPADYQVNYGNPIEPWNKPVVDLQLSRDQARKFWSHALKKYDRPWQVLIIVDQGGEDRRALSAAMAVADMLRIPRTAIFQPGEGSRDTIMDDEPENRWIFETLKMAKSMVVA